jgi:hypothetical protein
MPIHSDSPEPSKASWRTMRKSLDTTLPFLGTLVILGVTIIHRDLHNFIWVALGIVFIEMSLLRISHKLLPEKRRYNALRAQTNQFLVLVRQLNTAALHLKEEDTAENRHAVEEIRLRMLRKIDRLVEVAGKTDSDLRSSTLLATSNAVLASSYNGKVATPS